MVGSDSDVPNAVAANHPPTGGFYKLYLLFCDDANAVAANHSPTETLQAVFIVRRRS